MTRPDPNLTIVNIDKLSSELSVFSNQYDLRCDLHTFVEYVHNRDVKRLHRSNDLNKSDLKRLAKLMGYPDLIKEVEIHGYSEWISYVDLLAYLFDFVDYDTKGTYAGYTSMEPSFPENYIDVCTKKYNEYLELPLIEQEQRLLVLVVNRYIGEKNEFYDSSPFSRLSHFYTRGSATGIMPDLDFAQPRLFLLKVLQSCSPGVWYTTSSLVQYLKKHHPYFLIPKKPKYRYEHEEKKGRYINFYEGKDIWRSDAHVKESDPDAFERVEGRYVERFLEGLPLILGYVEVAYSKKEYKGNLPEMGQLQAFRVNDKFLHVMDGNISEPKVTIQPNFEIHVESELYPAGILAKLTKLADVVTKDKTNILKLKKKKVLTQLSKKEDLDVIKLLEDISAQKLPQNVKIELEEWTGASEAFTLYENVVLFEGDNDLPGIDKFTVHSISPNIRIVHSPKKLFTHLEQKGLVPLHIIHRSSALMRLPDGTRTVFPTQGQTGPATGTGKKAKADVKAQTEKKIPVTVKREVMITFHFPVKEVMEEFRNRLVAARCPVAADWSKLTLSFSSQYEPEAKNISKALKQDYTIKIKDFI